MFVKLVYLEGAKMMVAVSCNVTKPQEGIIFTQHKL